MRAIAQDREGHLWFGTSGGASRYDGQTFRTFTTKDGLANDFVAAIAQDREGHLWFGTSGGGASRYDGQTFRTFTTKDGLANDFVTAIAQDREGHVWVGTDGGGASRYDGQTFRTFTTKDGLAGDLVRAIAQDRDGRLWLGTVGGVTAYTETEVLGSLDRLVLALTFAPRLASYGPPPREVLWSYRLDDQPTWSEPSIRSLMVRDYWRLGSGKHVLRIRAWDGRANPPRTTVFPFEVSGSEQSIAIAAYLLLLGVPMGIGLYWIGKRQAARLAVQRQLNPYRAGLPAGPDLFTGRQDLLEEVTAALANHCVLLTGERRIGKTSFLHALGRRLTQLDEGSFRWIPCYATLEGIPEDWFFTTLAGPLVEFVRKELPPDVRLRYSPEPSPASPPYGFAPFVGDLMTITRALDGAGKKTVKLVFLIDEVDTLNSYSPGIKRDLPQPVPDPGPEGAGADGDDRHSPQRVDPGDRRQSSFQLSARPPDDAAFPGSGIAVADCGAGAGILQLRAGGRGADHGLEHGPPARPPGLRPAAHREDPRREAAQGHSAGCGGRPRAGARRSADGHDVRVEPLRPARHADRSAGADRRARARAGRDRVAAATIRAGLCSFPTRWGRGKVGMMSNPYKVGPPVHGDDHHGRIALLNQVLAGPRDCWCIVGLRRFGKTSFLHQLDYLTRSEGYPYVPIFWDLLGCENEEQLVGQLKLSILTSESIRSLAGFNRDGLDALGARRDLLALLRRLASASLISGRRLLLLCDECEALLKVSRNDEGLLGRLRSLFQSRVLARTVLVGSRQLAELHRADMDNSAFLDGFEPLTWLPPLTPEEIAGMDPAGMAPNSDLVRNLNDLTGGHPYFVQAIRSRMFEKRSGLRDSVESTYNYYYGNIDSAFERDYRYLSRHEARSS